MHVTGGAGYGLFEFSGYIFSSSAGCGHYREITLRAGNAFYWPLPLSLSRGGCCREVSIRVNVWNTDWDEKSWPLGEMAVVGRSLLVEVWLY